MADNSSLTKTLILDAPRDTVWAFLTDSDKLGEWYHPAIEDLAVGRGYILFKSREDVGKKPLIWGEVLEMDAPSRLVTTFVIGAFDGKETHVTWRLDDVAEGTRLSLIHEGVCEATGDAALYWLMSFDGGWDEHLSSLRKVLGKSK